MSKKTVINIKTDKNLKDEARKVADAMGIPLTTIINHYLRKLVEERRVEFEAPYEMSSRLEKLLDEVERDRKEGKNFSDPLSVEDTIKELKSL